LSGEQAQRAIFDDPQEWALFSEPQGDPAAQRWESQVTVQGMHCAACSLAVEQALLGVEGVLSARVSATARRASVVWSPRLTRPSQWLGAAQSQGYYLRPDSDTQAGLQERKQARLMLWRWLVSGFCMMQVMMYAFPAYIAEPGSITPDIEKLLRWASWVLTLPVLLFSCRPFFANAWRDLMHRQVSMDLPVALGMGITFAISSAATFEPARWWSSQVYFDSLTMFVFFLLTGRWLEQRLRARTSGSLDALMQRLPDSVEREGEPGIFERVSARRLRVDDLIRVLPGEAFPADGRVVVGRTFVDEALLTGESRPLPRGVGAAVMAGSYNLSAAVQVRIEQIGPSTRYAQIVALMGRAALDKPRLAQLADRVARPFLWFVMLAAVLAAAFWWSSDPARAVMAAVAVLVVTCPCALSLATPTAMLTSAGWLARQGILVRRLQALEALNTVDTVIFDKTGTLTEARMGLQGVALSLEVGQPCRVGLSAELALQLAGAIAQHSLHPVSRALSQAAAQARPCVPSGAFEVSDIQEHAGRGLQARITGPAGHWLTGLVRLGSAAFCGAVAPEEAQGLQVFLSDDTGCLARFEVDEVVRPDAARLIAQLQQAGLAVQMLSGDRSAPVRRLADRLGIRQAWGDCTAQGKLAHLEALQRAGHRVLMVGDGLNDGPVLALADVSIAMGQALPLAQAQSDFVMPAGQLMSLASLLRQARKTLRVVRQNLAWAALYNAVCVPLALMAYLPAWLAGLGMALSSLLVVANAARLARAGSGDL
jgi:Cu2+-exporting ATPase